jgi:hypothetical protein
VSLEQSYNLLLRAYPRRYRRIRGAEMLTTLIELAEPGRRRPSWRDAVDLVLGGLRYRFAPPRGRRHLVLATVNAIAFGLVLGSLAASLAWRVAQPETDRQLAPVVVGEADLPMSWTPAEADTGTLPGIPPAWLPVTHEGIDVRVARPDGLGVRPADLRDRLIVHGWQINDSVLDDGVVIGFSASRHGDTVLVNALERANRDNAYLVRVSYYHGRPGSVLPLAAGGLLAGLLVGWLLAAWLLRSWRAHGAGGRAWLTLVGAPIPVLELVLVAQVALAVLFDTADDENLGARWPIVGLRVALGSPVTLLIVLGLTVAAGIASAAPVRPQAPATPSGEAAR